MIHLFLVLGLSSAGAYADDESARIQAFMHTFVVEFAKMNTYLVSEKAFTSDKGKAVVGESLKALAEKVKNPPEALQRSPGFRITYGMLADHVQKTEEVFSRGEMEYARMRVNGIGNLCAACHMQVPKISHFSGFEFVAERSKDTTFENAEFLFVIRRYDEALAMYDKLTREYPKNGVPSDRLNDIYRRKLGIFARVFNDPALAIADFSADLKNKNLPMDVRRNVENWIEALQKWKGETSEPAKMKTPDLIAYVVKSLPSEPLRKIAPDSSQMLNILRLSGLLYKRLYAEPDGAQAQELLYYLARCERSLSPLYWYSVNEIYLKECVIQYPKKSFSQKCYDAYREGMEERYSGKVMPEGVRQSITVLKEYL